MTENTQHWSTQHSFTQPGVTGERADLLASLGKARLFLRFTTRGITEEQARQRTTVSALDLGGLIKHLTLAERNWQTFIVQGPSAMPDITKWTEQDFADRVANGFHLQDGETLDGALAAYEEVAKRTDELIATLPDLDASQPLPPAPWFPAGERWSARRVFLHLATEIAQHAGHADIIREALDGQQSMS